MNEEALNKMLELIRYLAKHVASDHTGTIESLNILSTVDNWIEEVKKENLKSIQKE